MIGKISKKIADVNKMPELDEKVDITPISPGLIKVERVIICPSCHKKVKVEFEFGMAVDDALGKGDEEEDDEG